MDQTYMKEKPILPLLLSMALPMVISMFVNSLYNIIDSIFVAKISEDAMTALSLVYPVQNLINSIAVGFGVGINAVIAMFLGAGKAKEADKTATQGLFLNVIHGILLTIVGLMIMPSFLAMFTNDQTVIGMGLQYSTIILMFSTIIMASISFEKIFQVVYILRPIHVKIRKDYLKLEAVCVKRLYAIGIPATLNMALPSFLVSALNAILASFSQTYVVVLGVYYKLQTFLYLTANGMIQGMRPIMSYNYGAKESDRVRKIYLMTFEIVVGIMAVGTVICFVVPQTLMSMFTNNPETLTEGAIALRIICAGFIASSVSVVSAGAFEALGKGIQSFLISFLRYVVVIIPAAFVLSKTVGVHGVWHAFWIAEIITAVIAFILYYQLIGKSGKEKIN